MSQFRIKLKKWDSGLTLDQALNGQSYLTNKLTAAAKTEDFRQNHLWAKKEEIEQLIARHTGLSVDKFVVTLPE